MAKKRKRKRGLGNGYKPGAQEYRVLCVNGSVGYEGYNKTKACQDVAAQHDADIRYKQTSSRCRVQRYDGDGFWVTTKCR